MTPESRKGDGILRLLMNDERRWRNLYALVLAVLAGEIGLFYLFTRIFR